MFHLEYLSTQLNLDLQALIQRQLEHHPFDSDRKRVKLLDVNTQTWQLSFRTWRIRFVLSENTPLQIQVNAIDSAYLPEELGLNQSDPYQDKQLHLEFHKLFKIKS
jgi:hypothetical protein